MLPRPRPKSSLSWPQLLKKWSIPFVPPCLRGLTMSSLSNLSTFILTASHALLTSIIYDVPWTVQIYSILWLLCWYLTSYYLGIGSIYFMISTLVGMMYHLGERQEGELSAYSVFNRNFTRLVGTVDAEQMIREQFGGGFLPAMMPALNNVVGRDGREGGGGGGGGGQLRGVEMGGGRGGRGGRNVYGIETVGRGEEEEEVEEVEEVVVEERGTGDVMVGEGGEMGGEMEERDAGWLNQVNDGGRDGTSNGNARRRRKTRK